MRGGNAARFGWLRGPRVRSIFTRSRRAAKPLLAVRRNRRFALPGPPLLEPGLQIELLQHAVRRPAPAVKLLGHADQQRVLLQDLERAVELLALHDRRP